MMVGKFPIGFAYNSDLKTTVIELPYRVQRLGMFLLLPDDVNGIFPLMRSLNESVLTQLISSMRKDSKEGVNVRVPKFAITSVPRMTDILRNSLRIRSLFSAGEADLSGMFLNLPSAGHVDDFVHKVILKVDEKGTVGAAASATVVERVGQFSGAYFEADHPFMFFLTDKQTGLILFAGVFAGPDSSSQNYSG
jgi:serpin B